MSQYLSAYTGNISKQYQTYENYGTVSLSMDNSIKSIRISGPLMDDYNKVQSLKEVTQLGNRITQLGDYSFYNCHNLTSFTSSGLLTDVGVSSFYGCENLNDLWFKGMTKAQLMDLLSNTTDACWPHKKTYYYGNGSSPEEGSFVWPPDKDQVELSSFVGTTQLAENSVLSNIYVVYTNGTLNPQLTYNGTVQNPSVLRTSINSVIYTDFTSESADVGIDYAGDELEQSRINAGTYYVMVIGKQNVDSMNFNGSVRIPYSIGKLQITSTSTSGSGTYSSNPKIGVTVTNTSPSVSDKVTIYYAEGDYQDPPSGGLSWSTTHPTWSRAGTFVVSYKVVGATETDKRNLTECYGKNTVTTTVPCDCYTCSVCYSCQNCSNCSNCSECSYVDPCCDDQYCP